MRISDLINSFLRKTQKYTGTDNVYLFKGGFWLTLNQVVGTGTSFLLAVALANLLDKTAYGNYQYILSLIGFLGIFSLQGIRTAIAQAVARGLEGSFYTGFKIRLKYGAIGSLVAIGLAIYYWLKGNEALSLPLIITAVFLPLMQASRVYSGFLAGRRLFDVGARYNMATDVISVGVMLATLLITKNVFWLIAAYLISNTFLNCFFDYLVKIKFKPNKEEDQKTLNYAKHLSLLGVLSLAGDYLDKILLFNFVGPAQLAVYSFAIALPTQIKGILANISILAFPKFAAQPEKEIKANIMKKFWKLALLITGIIIIYIAAAPLFYKIFFPKYLDSIIYSQVFIFFLISIPASLLDTVFNAKIMKKNIYIIKFFSFIRIILYIILIPIFGIWGLIAARVSMTFLNSALTLFLFRKFQNSPQEVKA